MEIEKTVLSSLVDAHNAFVSLDVYHPDDAREWCIYIHALQEKIMSRVAYRTNPELFIKKMGNNEAATKCGHLPIDI